MKALIIDDEEDVRSIARMSLARVGKMTVLDASCGADGIARAAAERPDVILLDVMMPSLDGPATIAELKSSEDTRSIPVVFLTAKAMPNEIERLRQLGAAGVIVKPFNPLTLADEVRKIVGDSEGSK